MTGLIRGHAPDTTKPEYGQRWLLDYDVVHERDVWLVITHVGADGNTVDWVDSDGRLWTGMDYRRRLMFFPREVDLDFVEYGSTR